MQIRCFALIALATACVSVNSNAIIVIEPDNYADGTILNQIVPQVSLLTVTANYSAHWDVTGELLPITVLPAPTGDNVFAHYGIPFFTSERRLRMDFDGLVSSISIIFQGVEWAAVGRLEAYDPYGQLLASYDTAVVQSGQFETMAITRENADIAMALAYPSSGAWGRLDHLTFSEPVPEPSSILLWGTSGLIALLAWRHSRGRKK